MLRLDPTNAPRVLELVPGLKVTVLPLTSALWMAAGADPLVSVNSPDAIGGNLTVPVVKAVARRAITAWEGVGDLDGNPLVLKPEWVDLLMDQYPVMDAFNEQYINPYLLLRAEGNASASSRTGTSGEATNTANAAGNPVQSVPS